MAKEKGMGKGLSALLGEDFSADFSTPSSTLPLSQIESCQNQPRKSFDQEKLEELAESIRQHGVIQPLTVRKLASGYYQIIAGERRWRAARLAGLEEIPAVVIEADDQKAMELAMIENLQREDLNPIEEAEGFRVLVETYGMTQEQAAERVGRSRSAVANALRLLDLNVSIQKLVEDGELSAGHARAILPLSPFLRVRAVSEITKGGLNVRQTEKLVKALMSHGREDPAPEKKASAEVDYAAEAAKSLSTRLGRACHISQGKKKGKIEIEYYGMDDLNDLLEALERLGK
ncbi:MAG: ParB/RepB/Spo0J family partition protein [Oscillospiraceae bacterium]|nr:ParB/RepB/Spo0J family partition protein [Oscillospiraceae bacterium]MCI8941479.1 ParB/RepB/Spo0J family partition protein [Oscillospiraceae bacterium]